MEKNFKATGGTQQHEAGVSTTQTCEVIQSGRLTLENCVVPVASTCFVLQFISEAGIGQLTDYLHEVAKTCHTYGAVNLTVIIAQADLHMLHFDGFFGIDNQRKLVGDLAIEIRYLFASEKGAFHFDGPLPMLGYVSKCFAKRSLA